MKGIFLFFHSLSLSLTHSRCSSKQSLYLLYKRIPEQKWNGFFESSKSYHIISSRCCFFFFIVWFFLFVRYQNQMTNTNICVYLFSNLRYGITLKRQNKTKQKCRENRLLCFFCLSILKKMCAPVNQKICLKRTNIIMIKNNTWRVKNV